MAKANNVDLDIVTTEPANGVSNDYLRLNHLGKIPSFVGEDGYELTESIAIAIYGMPAPCRRVCNRCNARSLLSRGISSYDETFNPNSYPCLKTTVENHSHSDRSRISLHLYPILFGPAC